MVKKIQTMKQKSKKNSICYVEGHALDLDEHFYSPNRILNLLNGKTVLPEVKYYCKDCRSYQQPYSK